MVNRHIHVQGNEKEGHGCPFCNLEPARVYADNDLAGAVLDGYPVSSGHTRIIPKRHF